MEEPLEEEEGEEQYEDDVLNDINPDTLLIQRTRTDDTFVGRLSKFVFQRLPSHENIFLTPHQEIAIYIRYHILPLLREILYDRTDRFFIWQAACIEYFKENDPQQITTRWSSFRNANWYSPILDSNEQTEAYILEMTDEFVADTLADISEMSSYFGSAWQFLQIRFFHLRYVKAGAHNLIRFGKRPQPTSFHPDLTPLLRNLVLDPQHFSQTIHKGLCIPISIILSILIRSSCQQFSSISRKMVSQGLNALNFQQFLQHSDGISISDFRRLESANTPLPYRLIQEYPAIETYRGIALNLYRSVVRPDPDNTQKKQIFIFPMVLSANHKDEAFFQVDLLLDSTDLRPEGRDSATSPKSALHVLTIHNLIALLTRNSYSKYKHSTRYTHICRSCCQIFTAKEDLDIHRRYISCRRHLASYALPNELRLTSFTGLASLLQPGEFANAVRQRTERLPVYLEQTRTMGRKRRTGYTLKGPCAIVSLFVYSLPPLPIITFYDTLLSKFRSHLCRTLLPLSICAMDLECLADPASVIDSRPAGAEAVETPFAYSIAHASLYTEHKLPSNLRSPRGMIYDPTTQSEHDFVISLLKTLRRDLKLHTDFLHETLKKDPGPPNFSQMTAEEKTAFFLQSACSFCGRRFSKKVKKNRDHIHFLKSSRLAR